MVTGSTGFVGSHSVEALLRAGHSVRLLIRSREKLARVLGGRDLEVDDYVVGDMTDRAAVGEALDGCDAALHAAATLYGGGEVFEANVAGVRCPPIDKACLGNVQPGRAVHDGPGDGRAALRPC